MNDPQKCFEEAKRFAETLDSLDILINNAGVSQRVPFIDFDMDSCINLINTNCLSHIALIKAFLPLLKRCHKEDRGHARIINISSLAGLMGVGVRTCYAASKFGISGFSRALRSEVKKDGIMV